MDLNHKKLAALQRTQRELKEDPDKYKKLGSEGGKAKVQKGFAVNKEALQIAIEKSKETRNRKEG